MPEYSEEVWIQFFQLRTQKREQESTLSKNVNGLHQTPTFSSFFIWVRFYFLCALYAFVLSFLYFPKIFIALT